MSIIIDGTYEQENFYHALSGMLAAPVISPLFAWAFDEKLKNWAGNVEYSTGNLYSPASAEEAREFVGKQAHLKVLGTRHCFNNIANSKDQFLSMKLLDKIVELDAGKRTMTLGAE